MSFHNWASRIQQDIPKKIFALLLVFMGLTQGTRTLAEAIKSILHLTQNSISYNDSFEYILEIQVPRGSFFVWDNPGEIEAETPVLSWDFKKAKLSASGYHLSTPEPVKLSDSGKIAFGYTEKLFIWGQILTQNLTPKGAQIQAQVEGSICSLKTGNPCKKIRFKSPFKNLDFLETQESSSTRAREVLSEMMAYFPNEQKLNVHLKNTEDSISLEIPKDILEKNGTFDFFQKEKGPIEFLAPNSKNLDTLTYGLALESQQTKTTARNYVYGLLRVNPTLSFWVNGEIDIPSADEITKEHIRQYSEPSFFEKYRWLLGVLCLVTFGVAFLLLRKIKKSN
jgi:DsbC/DsbD-like thiol-disulfide interchange protein